MEEMITKEIRVRDVPYDYFIWRTDMGEEEGVRDGTRWSYPAWASGGGVRFPPSALAEISRLIVWSSARVGQALKLFVMSSPYLDR